MDDRLSIDDARAQFAALGDLAYLDVATQGVPCADAVAALAAATADWARGIADHDRWEADADAARTAVAALLGVPACDLALVGTTAGFLSSLAADIGGGTVVVPEIEYRSASWPWLVGRDPAAVRTVVGAPSTADLVAAIDDDVALVAVSAVQSFDGHAVDLRTVVAAAHAHDAIVVVDATQALGATGLELVSSGADAIIAMGYKWLGGGRGTGFAYVKPTLHDILPLAPGPRAAADGAPYGARLALHTDARRFDTSSAWLPWVATRPAVELIARVGAAALQEHSLQLVARVRANLRAAGHAAFTNRPEGPTPIVGIPCADAQSAVDALRRRGIRCVARGASIRAGFPLFSTAEHADRLVDALLPYLGAPTAVPDRSRRTT